MSGDLLTVIFDLGGVYFTDGTTKAINVISEKYSLDVHMVANTFRGELGSSYREDKISSEIFWEIAKKSWKIENEPTCELAQIWLEGYVPLEENINIIMQLKKNGHEVLYLSGSARDRVEYLRKKYNFTQHFEGGIFSFAIGVRKPALLPYQCILKMASNIPQNCIYIDDKEKYLIPARRLGMKTILFASPKNLRCSLNKLGVNC